MSSPNIETCPVCGVKIENSDRVLFSLGTVGTRATLWARVCNYVRKSECINQDTEAIGPIEDIDYYKPSLFTDN